MANKTRLCGYKHCRCETSEIPTGTEVFVSGRYYHLECANDCLNIREIKKEYIDNISNTVVQGILGKVINNIIFDKKVESDFFLYAIKYAIQNKIKINSPYGLHYVIDNGKIKDAYHKEKAKIIAKKIGVTITCDSSNDTVFIRKVKEKSTIEDIL